MEIKAPKFNVDNLFEMHTYTDIVLGSITHHIPVTLPFGGGNAARDILREETFTGNTVLHTTRGPMNISFPIEADSLQEAVLKFDETLAKTIQDMQAQSLRSRIITGGGTFNKNN